MKSLDSKILELPLAGHNLSPEFIASCTANGYHTLFDLFSIPITELMEMEWFKPDHLKELAAVIKTFDRN